MPSVPDSTPSLNANPAGDDAQPIINTSLPSDAQSGDPGLPEGEPGAHGGNGHTLSENPAAEQVQAILGELRNRPLHESHLADLRDSGLTDAAIAAAGLCSATADESKLFGFHASPALLIPYLQHRGYVRIKPDDPRVDDNGRPIKYETLRGSVNHLYMPPSTHSRLMSMAGCSETNILITEGEKKALKADQEGFTTIAVPGVWAWRNPTGALRELDQIDWQGKTAFIVFDSDVTRKVDVKEAIVALSDHLRQAGADVRVVLLPDVEGLEKTGLDDFLVANGADALRRLMGNAGDRFAALLDMIERGLSAEDLEEVVQPVYRVIQKLGPLGLANHAGELRQRLQILGYQTPPKAELQRAIRNARPYRPEGASAGTANNQAENSEPVIRYVAEGPCGDYADQPERQGFYDLQPKEPRQLTNFVLRIEENVSVYDDLKPQRRFAGRIKLLGQERPFSITATDFANNGKLQAAIYEAAGPKAEFHCRLEELRTAISAVSAPEVRQITTNFGWDDGGGVYLVQGGRITRTGFHPASEDDDVHLELTDTEFARRLDLRPLEPEQLSEAKRHVISDLIHLCPDQRVGLALLGTVALAPLYRFADGFNRPVFWIVGLSGGGKSFMGKLFQNFFGDFPVAGENSTMSWQSTANRIQYDGYFFRDALYLVDDYKPEHCNPQQATRVLQAYADSAARSRLRRDATAAESREIRGLLLCTGEDVPDHSASASARLVKIPYPSGEKDLVRGRRCREHRRLYSGITADFIRHVLANGRAEAFVQRVDDLHERFYKQVVGRDNDVRIAGNFALLGAAFEEIAGYLEDAWPGVAEVRQRFIDEDVTGLMRQTLADVGEQKASQIFLHTLAMLVQQGKVRVSGSSSNQSPSPSAALIGRALSGEARAAAGDSASNVGRRAPVGNANTVLEIWTGAALGEVQESLRQQNRPQLQISDKALIDQLRDDGVLLDSNNEPIVAGGERVTRQVSIGGCNRRGFRIRQNVLMEGWQ